MVYMRNLVFLGYPTRKDICLKEMKVSADKAFQPTAIALGEFQDNEPSNIKTISAGTIKRRGG